MRFYRVFPDPRLMIDAATPEGHSTLASLYAVPEGPSVRVNMIVTPGGDTTGLDHTSGSLSSPTDRALVTLLREQADAVIIGAETLRRERIPLPSHSPLVVLTRRGEVAWDNLVVRNSESHIVVVTDSPKLVSAVPSGVTARMIDGPPGELTPHRVVAMCAGEGWNRLLVEGGRHTATAFAEADAIDDLCLTLTGPPAVDTSPPLDWWPNAAHWETTHLLTDDHRMLYHRFRRTHSPT